jgi:hypothetical protein
MGKRGFQIKKDIRAFAGSETMHAVDDHVQVYHPNERTGFNAVRCRAWEAIGFKHDTSLCAPSSTQEA